MGMRSLVASLDCHFLPAKNDCGPRAALGTWPAITILVPTEPFQALRGGDIKERQNWAYIMLLLRPNMIKFPNSGLLLQPFRKQK
jgi:hypothetical protein